MPSRLSGADDPNSILVIRIRMDVHHDEDDLASDLADRMPTLLSSRRIVAIREQNKQRVAPDQLSEIE